MAYELKGTISKILDKQSFSETFEKRDFIVKTDDDYPQFISLTLKNKMIPLLDEYSEGDDVVVNFNIEGKEDKNGRFWNNLSAWRLRKTKDVPTANEEQKKPKGKKTKKEKEEIAESAFQNPSKDKDMPF